MLWSDSMTRYGLTAWHVMVWQHDMLWSDSMTRYGLTAWHGMVWQHDTVWSDSMTWYDLTAWHGMVWQHDTLWSDSMTRYGLTAWHGMVWQHDSISEHSWGITKIAQHYYSAVTTLQYQHWAEDRNRSKEQIIPKTMRSAVTDKEDNCTI